MKIIFSRPHKSLALHILARIIEVADDEWWEGLTKDQQETYIEDHPNSKYAEKVRQASRRT